MGPQGQFRAVSALNREIGDQGRHVLGDRRVPRHQKIDDHIDIGTAVAGGDGTHELKAATVLPLAVTLPQEGIHEPRVVAVAQGLRIQGEIHVQGSDMRHVGTGQQQPGNGAADHGEPFPVAA